MFIVFIGFFINFKLILMKRFLKAGVILPVILVSLSIFGISAMLYSYANGVASCTQKPGSTYNGCSCHSNGVSTAITSGITGPDTLTTGQTSTYTFSITRSGTWRGGVDIAVSSGTLSNAPSGFKILSGELVQSARLNSSNTYSNTFSYTAPSTPGTVTMYITGCAQNGSQPAWNHGPNKTIVVKLATGIEKTGNIPTKYSLAQNYPNPFNPMTTIDFGIAKAGKVKLTVSDISGKTVDILVNRNLEAGEYKFNWNASKFASGVYFYRLEANSFTDVKRLILVK